MRVPRGTVTPFDLEIENAHIKSHLEDKPVDICVNQEIKSLFRSNIASNSWRNVNVTLYP